MHRRQKLHIPLLPKTIEEFEQLINDPKYKKQYMFDKTNKLFYHGVWRGPAGENIVFISEEVLNKIRKKKSIQFLMDGTFKVKLFFIYLGLCSHIVHLQYNLEISFSRCQSI